MWRPTAGSRPAGSGSGGRCFLLHCLCRRSWRPRVVRRCRPPAWRRPDAAGCPGPAVRALCRNCKTDGGDPSRMAANSKRVADGPEHPALALCCKGAGFLPVGSGKTGMHVPSHPGRQGLETGKCQTGRCKGVHPLQRPVLRAGALLRQGIAAPHAAMHIRGQGDHTE